MKLKLLLLYSIHATYRKIQMTEMQKSLSETSLTLLEGCRLEERVLHELLTAEEEVPRRLSLPLRFCPLTASRPQRGGGCMHSAQS